MNIDQLYLMYNITVAVFVFIFGAVIGSFLNVVVYRTPIHESIVKGSSHCMTCGHQIKWYDLFPIFSWLILGGKCRNCKAKISPRYMIIETLTGAAFLISYLVLGFSVKFAFSVVLFAILVVLSCIDIDHFEIPYWCSITIGVLGVLSFFLITDVPYYERLISLGVIGVLFIVLVLLGGMGGGDLQLMAGASLLLGYSIFPALGVGLVLGSVYGIIYKLIVKNDEKAAKKSVTDCAEKWIAEIAESGGLNIGKSDIICGDISDGKLEINRDVFDEKAWKEIPETDTLSAELSERLSAERESVIRIHISDNKVTKVKYTRRIVFGPFLSIGIAFGYLFGAQVVSWYISLL